MLNYQSSCTTNCDSEFNRRGASRSSVVVAILTTTLVFTVVLPAIYSSQETARKVRCGGQIRMLALAWIAESTTDDRRNGLPLSDTISLEEESVVKMTVGWPYLLLPRLDRTALQEKVTSYLRFHGAAGGELLQRSDAEWIRFPELICPSDLNANRSAGRISYVANAGFCAAELFYGDPDLLHRLGSLSWNGNQVVGESVDILIGAATGVMWPSTDAITQHYGRIYQDGISYTLLFSENLQGGYWFDSEMPAIGFSLPVPTKRFEVGFGSGAMFESLERPLNTEFQNGALLDWNPMEWRINSEPGSRVGTRPRPSSAHSKCVNVAFCDGSCRTISSYIDPHVYVKLLTPQGTAFGELPQVE